MSTTLYALTGALADLHRMSADTDDESALQAVRDTLEGLEGDLAHKLDGVAKARSNLTAAAMAERVKEDAFRAEADRYAKRAESLGRRAVELDDYVLRCLRQAGIDKPFDTGSHTVSIRQGRPSVVITDASVIPTQLTTTETTRKPDKRAIGDQLKAGEDVPGAVLKDGPDKIVIR